MSRDVTFFRVSRITEKVPDVISDTSPFVSDTSGYRMVYPENAASWQKEIGTACTVKGRTTDFQMACMQNFGVRFTSCQSISEGRFRFFADGKELGTLTGEELKRYDKEYRRQVLIFAQEEIHVMQSPYQAYHLRNALYTAEELWKEAFFAEQEGSCSEGDYELWYALSKCAYLAQNENAMIWCCIE